MDIFDNVCRIKSYVVYVNDFYIYYMIIIKVFESVIYNFSKRKFRLKRKFKY